MANVFISYARVDHQVAKALADHLTANKLTEWWDRRLLPGDEFRREIDAQIDAADAVIVMWSDASIKSGYVCDEAQRAKDKDKFIATRLDGFEVENIPVGFRGRQTCPVDDYAAILAA